MNPSKNRRAGAQYELDMLKGLRNEGLDVERLRLSGRHDEGDLVIKAGGLVHIIECKNAKQMDLAGWVGELETEIRNYARARDVAHLPLPHGAVYIKRRGVGLYEGYAVMPIHEHLRLIQTNTPPF